MSCLPELNPYLSKYEERDLSMAQTQGLIQVPRGYMIVLTILLKLFLIWVPGCWKAASIDGILLRTWFWVEARTSTAWLNCWVNQVTCLGFSPAPGPNLKKPCAALAHLAGMQLILEAHISRTDQRFEKSRRKQKRERRKERKTWTVLAPEWLRVEIPNYRVER